MGKSKITKQTKEEEILSRNSAARTPGRGRRDRRAEDAGEGGPERDEEVEGELQDVVLGLVGDCLKN